LAVESADEAGLMFTELLGAATSRGWTEQSLLVRI